MQKLLGEIEQSQLEKEKLRVEIRNAKWPLLRVPSNWTGLITAIAFCTGLGIQISQIDVKLTQRSVERDLAAAAVIRDEVRRDIAIRERDQAKTERDRYELAAAAARTEYEVLAAKNMVARDTTTKSSGGSLATSREVQYSPMSFSLPIACDWITTRPKKKMYLYRSPLAGTGVDVAERWRIDKNDGESAFARQRNTLFNFSSAILDPLVVPALQFYFTYDGSETPEASSLVAACYHNAGA